jgi:hypothetical protein
MLYYTSFDKGGAIMELSVHDNILYGYVVVSDQDQSRSYTITLYTEFLDRLPIEYTDIVFTGVVAHHFENELPNSILFDVEEADLGRVYEDDQELFERLKNYGWPPYAYTTVDELVATLKAEQIKAFAISASYGLDGWVWAKQMTKVRRDSRNEFA